MKRDRIILGVAALAAACAIALFVSDSRKEKPIQVFHSNRPTQAQGEDNPVSPIAFGLSEEQRLTGVRVYLLAELEGKKTPLPVWALTTKSNSVPTKGFLYGQPIEGMELSTLSTRENLQPGAAYRLVVEAGPRKASHDFIPVAAQRRHR